MSWLFHDRGNPDNQHIFCFLNENKTNVEDGVFNATLYRPMEVTPVHMVSEGVVDHGDIVGPVAAMVQGVHVGVPGGVERH